MAAPLGKSWRAGAGAAGPHFELVSGNGLREARPVRIELSSRAEIEACLAALGHERVDVLVNNAGYFAGGLLERQKLDQLYEMIQVNVAGLVHLTRAFLPGMLRRGHGKIVNNASIAAYAHFPGAAVYSATKAAVAGFSEALRRELEECPVTVLQLVTPGVETDMLEEVREAYEPQRQEGRSRAAAGSSANLRSRKRRSASEWTSSSARA